MRYLKDSVKYKLGRMMDKTIP